MSRKIVVGLLGLLLLGATVNGTDYKTLWTQVDAALEQGLPQSAEKILRQIHSLAVERKEWGQALHALSKRIACQADVAGNKPAERIKILKAEIETAPVPMRPLMKLMLSQWYWHFYQRERWRFLNRSTTARLDDDDFTTWDLPKLFAEISGLFQGLLAEAETLQNSPLEQYQAVLEPGNMPPQWRATLYDFAAWTALEFYTSAEQAGARPENAFELDAASPALADLKEFLDWRPESEDNESAQLLAIRLYQNVLRFQQGLNRPDALADADLHRLHYVRQTAFGESAGTRYLDRLGEWVDKLGQSDLAAQACYLAARENLDQDETTAAMNWCKQGLATSRSGRGHSNCAALQAQLQQKEYEIQTLAVQLPGRPLRFTVRYRNIDRLHLRVVPERLVNVLNASEPLHDTSYPDNKTYRNLIRGKAVAAWSVDLEPTTDFRFRTQTVSGPALPAGLYRVLASWDPDFATMRNRMATTLFQLSRLALASRVQPGDMRRFEGLVCAGDSGLPASDVKLSAYRFDYNQQRYVMFRQGQSDEQGHFSLECEPNDYSQQLLLADSPQLGQVLQTVNYGHVDRRNPDFLQPKAVFFTDRSLYRPGQTIHFKAILLRPGSGKASHEPAAGQTVRVTFHDANNQEVASQELRSNDFGSIAGSFTAPTDRLAGRMSLRCSWSSDQTWINVEEYKRPKFAVRLDLPEREYRLDETVTVAGQALAYTGAAVDGAAVVYRVTRMVRYPRWCSWLFPNAGQTQEIVHGRLKSDAEGRFAISFPARPDLKVDKKSQPVFTYQISADLTDSSGETRSDSISLILGYTALTAELSAPEWLPAGQAQVLTASLSTHNGRPLTGKGRIEIHALKGPERPLTVDIVDPEYGTQAGGPDWQRWPLGELEAQKEFSIEKAEIPCRVEFRLPAGAYRARLLTRDRFGSEVEAVAFLLVHDPAAAVFPVAIPLFASARQVVLEVGESYEALLGTGFEKGSMRVEVYYASRCIKSYWTQVDNTQQLLRIPVTEAMRGGFSVLVSCIHDQRLYQRELFAQVPWNNRLLSLRWQSFRSRLLPGQKESWSLLIQGPNAEKRAAELVATLYDESLDQLLPHHFPDFSFLYRQSYSNLSYQFANRSLYLMASEYEGFNSFLPFYEERYPRFPDFIAEAFYGYGMRYAKKGLRLRSGAAAPGEERMLMAEAVAPAPQATAAGVEGGVLGGVLGAARGGTPSPKTAGRPQTKPQLDNVQARSDFSETAFFFPQLRSDGDGLVRLEFTMPQALTRWRFLGLAHSASLEYGLLEDHAVTSKDLMVQPNPPRFLREGDELEFTVKISNQTERDSRGRARLSFFDPQSGRSLDRELANQVGELDFSIPGKQSRTLSWKIRVPDSLGVVAYKAVAASDRHSDGEEGQFPVLARHIAVQETLPLWISQAGEKSFAFKKLRESGSSDSLRHLSLTAQMVSNPAWYAVQALPYLMEYPYECSEQTFNRLYANSLARHIAASDPKIRSVFDAWKGTQALKSKLEQNQELKSALLEESPWVLEAQSETQARQRVGLLLDRNHINQEIRRALEKLTDMQYDDGAWPWFPGGQRSEFITLYIVSGYGRLRHLGVEDLVTAPARKACIYLDNWLVGIHRQILRGKGQENNHLSPLIALYLYARSFFLQDLPPAAATGKALDYFQTQARQFWLQLGSRQSQAQLALGLLRLGDPASARTIMRSIKERSRLSEEMGRYWSDTELSWWWHRAPIETQALMIEAFAEVMNDAAAVEECKIWLLKQKQTRDWKTTKATADAVYALLLRGEKLLASDRLVELSLGGRKVEPDKVEIGSGFYEKRFAPGEIKPEMAEIRIKKSGPGIAWGGLHWQYLEDISKISAHADTPLKLKKSLFVQRQTVKGPVIEPVSGPLEVGDLLVVRIELRSDRDMEYLHLKDHRGSGLEPTDVLSGYRFQDGLAYYESTRDTASHFFIDYLPKGSYVFEYRLRVVHKGRYQTGLAAISCMYAPEFNSHSESLALEVR